MTKMKAAQVTHPGGPIELVEREVPQPGASQLRVRVHACGICHSDVFAKEGHWPGIQYPRVPGHEVAGVIDEVGVGVKGWAKGQRVGVGWYGGIRRCDITGINRRMSCCRAESAQDASQAIH